jgi:hypothetical protein
VVRQIQAQLKADAHVLRSIDVQEGKGGEIPKETRCVMVGTTQLERTPTPLSRVACEQVQVNEFALDIVSDK